MTRKQVLWIEDSAFTENTSLAAPLLLSGKYDLTVALNATTALEALAGQSFAAVIVDIRIPPGDDKRWIDIYYKSFRSNKAARLGLKLLEVLLGQPDELWQDTLAPGSREASRYGVLSVEGISELRSDLARLGVTVYRDKGEGDAPGTLLEMVDEITRQCTAPDGAAGAPDASR